MATMRTIFHRAVLLLFFLLLLAGVSQGMEQDAFYTEPVISSWGDIVERYEQFRDDSYPLIVPGDDFLTYGSWEKVQSDLTAFVKGSWFWYFSASCYRVDPESKLSRHICGKIDLLVYEDIYSGEIIVAEERKDGTYVEVYSQKTISILDALALGMTTFEETSRRRIVWQPSIAPYDYIDPVELASESDESLLRTMSVPVPPDGDTNSGGGAVLLTGMTPEQWAAIHSASNMWISADRFGSPPTTACLVQVHVPATVTNLIDIFSKAELTNDGPWVIAAGFVQQNAALCAVWTDSVSNVEHRYYRAADAVLDSDGDSLADGRERFVYETDQYNSDSDSDGVSDGDEILSFQTDPNNGDVAAPTIFLSVDHYQLADFP